MSGLSFTAIDFETANGNRVSACSVGLVRIREGQVVDRVYHLVKPPVGFGHFLPRNTAIHGLTERDVESAPEWGELAEEVTAFIGTDILVAHNTGFDKSVFEQAFDAYDLEWPRRSWVCSLALARSSLVLPSYGLPWVTDHLGLPSFEHHDAAADAEASAQVVLALAKQLGFDEMHSVAGHAQRRILPEDIKDSDLGLEGVAADGEGFKGEVVCFTGAISMSRKDAEDLVLKEGGTISGSVTLKTTVLVVGGFDKRSLRPGATTSSKFRRAVAYAERGQSIEILTEQEFFIRLANQKEEIKRRLADKRNASLGRTKLEAWAISAAREAQGMRWSEFLRKVRHPAGRAVGGESCSWCGDRVSSDNHWAHRDRHVCGYRCNSSIKQAWRRLGYKEDLFST